MSEKEKKIIETLNEVVKNVPAQSRDYLLGWAEGAAYVVCGPRQTEERTGV